MEGLLHWIAATLLLVAGNTADPAYWHAVLERLDGIRAAAYVQADPELLKGVYAPGSPLRKDDTAVIVDYTKRGLRVSGMNMQVSALRVLDHDRRGARLELVDRLGRTLVRPQSGSVRALPADQWTRRTIALTMTADGWRIISAQKR